MKKKYPRLLLIQKMFKIISNDFNINYYVTNIKGNIAYLDFLLDRLYDMKYINEKNLYKITTKLIEINKMASGWLNNKNESQLKRFKQYL